MVSALTGCANSQAGKNLEQSLAADPQLQDNPNPIAIGQQSNPQTSPNQPTANLPSDFPSVIPKYKDAVLREVSQTTGETNADAATVTRWTSADPVNFVLNFYKQQFQQNNWQIVSQPEDEAGGTFEARQNDLKVKVSIQPIQNTTAQNQNTEAATEFNIEYLRNSDRSETAAQPTTNPTTAAATPPSTPTPTPTPTATASVTPTPTPTPTPTSQPQATNATSTAFTDISKAPPELRSYITDLAELGVLNLNSQQFDPNKPITRKEFARWLVAANNKINSNNPAKQIRLATADSAQPAFTDVPRTHPDFAAIQGLAEAGLIPSSLAGDTSAALFRPDAPLTREQMLLWKVPLDTRLGTSSGSFDLVKQTWGFQDATKIDPKALKAVIADFQNGDGSNIRRVFGYTTLFQPKKPVTRAEAAGAIWYFGNQNEGLSAKDALGNKSS